MNERRTLLGTLLGLTIAAMPLGALAADPMPMAPMNTSPAAARTAPLTPAESTFAAGATSTLTRLYATTAVAEKAGYARYTNEDRSGAISYVNPKNIPSDISHPAQLWYDVNGRLIGADYSQNVADAPNGPTLFGLSAARFHKIPLHVHYVTRAADGKLTYGLFIPADAFRAAGGDPEHPTAADLVKMGKVPSADHVALVVAITNNWDAQVWVVPNPDGQFADNNPNVKPSANQGGGNGETRG